MKVLIASDHAGFVLKKDLSHFLAQKGYEVVDFGPDTLNIEDDYPDFVAPLAREISENPGSAVGIVIGGSGQGEAMMANRFPHVRAAVFNGQYVPTDGRKMPDEILLSRQHNDSNILALGARFLTKEEAEAAVLKWLTTPFPADDRHNRRIEKIETMSPHFRKDTI